MRKSLMFASTIALALGAASAQTTTTTTTTTASQVSLSDVPAGHWAKDAVDRIVQCGLIQGFPDGTFRGNENLTRYQAALIFYRMLQTGALANCGLSQQDMTVVTRGMAEVSTELAAIANRVTDLERLTAEQQARIAALEEKINAAGTADTTALTARIDALEAAIRNIPAGPQGPAGPAGPQGPAGPAGTSATVTTPAPTTDTTVVIGEPVVNEPAATSNLYAGISVGAAATDSSIPCYMPNAGPNGKAVNYCVAAGAMIGSKNILGPVGARIAAEYAPGKNGFNADVNATYHLETGSMITPYVGAGLGISSSYKRGTNGTANATDTYVNVLAGVDFNITSSIAAYVEANGRYYLSNNGTASGMASTAPDAKGFNIAGKAGLKFYF